MFVLKGYNVSKMVGIGQNSTFLVENRSFVRTLADFGLFISSLRPTKMRKNGLYLPIKSQFGDQIYTFFFNDRFFSQTLEKKSLLCSFVLDTIKV